MESQRYDIDQKALTNNSNMFVPSDMTSHLVCQGFGTLTIALLICPRFFGTPDSDYTKE